MLACASGEGRPDGRPTDDAAVAIDGAPQPDVDAAGAGDRDAATVADSDAAPPPDADAAVTEIDAASTGPIGTHLLLTEVVLQPTDAEMIEILNPTDAAIALTDYYLADTGSYFSLPAGAQDVGTSDFVVRFPSGASLAAGAVATVAIASAAAFTASHGVAPTYALGAGGAGTAQLIAVDVGSMPTLTNAGEAIALFHWDGAGDLVDDVDLVNAGHPSAGNLLLTKSGVAIDGPDGDAVPTSYAAEAFTLGSQSMTPGDGKSTKRILPETGHEQSGSGNGIAGDDETSEAIGVTWDATPFAAPTPGAVPASLH